jgi:hypothetical protein
MAKTGLFGSHALTDKQIDAVVAGVGPARTRSGPRPRKRSSLSTSDAATATWRPGCTSGSVQNIRTSNTDFSRRPSRRSTKSASSFTISEKRSSTTKFIPHGRQGVIGSVRAAVTS